MDVTPLIRPGQKIIQSYRQGKFKISGETFDGPVIVGPDFVQEWSASTSVTDPAQFAFLAGQCDVLLLGTGASASVLPPMLRQKFRDEGLSVDVMDTGAACRTFNVLMAEGRRVAAALIPL